MRIKAYNNADAVLYANEWALKRNPNYYNFDAIGGDCTNFVSQCIFAGAKVMNYAPTGWYYNSSSDRAPAWTSVEFLYKFLINNSGAGPFAKLTDTNSLSVGDVVQLGSSSGRFYHSLLVTHVDGNDVLVASHTTDSLNRNLNTYFFAKVRYIKIIGVRY